MRIAFPIARTHNTTPLPRCQALFRRKLQNPHPFFRQNGDSVNCSTGRYFGWVFHRIMKHLVHFNQDSRFPRHISQKECPVSLFGRRFRTIKSIYSQSPRKFFANFVLISENVLDKQEKGWYSYQARVGGICGFFRARDAMMREIARKTR